VGDHESQIVPCAPPFFQDGVPFPLQQQQLDAVVCALQAQHHYQQAAAQAYQGNQEKLKKMTQKPASKKKCIMKWFRNTYMLQLKIPKSRMMKYSCVSSLIGSYIPLTLYCLEQLLTEISVKLELARK